MNTFLIFIYGKSMYTILFGEDYIRFQHESGIADPKDVLKYLADKKMGVFVEYDMEEIKNPKGKYTHFTSITYIIDWID